MSNCSNASTASSQQKHVHEVQGVLEIAEAGTDPHNHRFCTVSGEAKTVGNTHVHEVTFRTDYYDNHFHEYTGKTCGAVQVGDRHVHFLKSITSRNDGHKHEFRLATFIENPIDD
mgnify:CR=1 FL=1